MSVPRTLVSSALAAALALAAPAAAVAAPPVAAEQVTVSAHRAPAPSSDNRYAERERQDATVGEYEGGSTIVIGISGGTLVVVLLILLLI